ncbi:uncharacterized protein LOC131859151 [Cryptomeria japonica]|uniref:uncharacterized protein LOC131859151 n=1 Tax=Cryptomeria japonica TaxID=3369 RepID=UPI0027DA0219|nr:uncharacterized protein LOC131859151 [Cryptomeria japonica]
MTEIEENEEKHKEEEKKQEEMTETKENKKTMVDTLPVKRKLDLEKESEKKKVKFTTAASSVVKDKEMDEETEEEEEEDFVIDIKKMNPKQLMKVSGKLKLQAEKAKFRAKTKKTKILNTAKTILSNLIPDIAI